jgi:hypothetical protein
VIQLEATIRSAHTLLQAGLISDATSLLAALPPFRPKFNRALIEHCPIQRGGDVVYHES